MKDATPARFPIMRTDWRDGAEAGLPESVPWEFMAPHEAQARCNHDQSLKRLAERGGLDVTEALAVLHARAWRRMDLRAAVAEFLAMLAEWNGAAAWQNHLEEGRKILLCSRPDDPGLAEMLSAWGREDDRLVALGANASARSGRGDG